jgi:hypothetical protein
LLSLKFQTLRPASAGGLVLLVGTNAYVLALFIMLRAQELLAKAAQCEKRAEIASDPLLTNSLRQCAQRCRDMAVEVDVLEHDPAYRLIHDRGLDDDK